MIGSSLKGNIQMIRIRQIAAGVIVVLALAAPSARAEDKEDEKSDKVLSSDEVLGRTGKTIDEWGAAWWQWAFVTPGVLGDTTGQFGPKGDVRGPVFFAEGSGGGAVKLEYTAPAGKYILLPVATYIWTFFPPCADPRCAAHIVDDNFVAHVKNAYATVEGVKVGDMQEHVVRVSHSNPLIFLVNAGPIDPTSGYGGILPAEQSGYWLMLAPLSPGTHQFAFGATIPNLDPNTGDALPGTTGLQTTLTLHVKK
jgi:hypothetical protein